MVSVPQPHPRALEEAIDYGIDYPCNAESKTNVAVGLANDLACPEEKLSLTAVPRRLARHCSLRTESPMAADSPDKIHPASSINANGSADVLSKSKSKARQRNKDPSASNKRRCVSTACIACRRRKSKACHTSNLYTITCFCQ